MDGRLVDRRLRSETPRGSFSDPPLQWSKGIEGNRVVNSEFPSRGPDIKCSKEITHKKYNCRNGFYGVGEEKLHYKYKSFPSDQTKILCKHINFINLTPQN